MLNGDSILSCKNNLRVKSFRNEKNHMYHECGVQSHFLKVCHNVFFYKFTPSLVRFECMWQYHSHLRMEYRFIDSHMIGAIPTGEPLNPIKLNPLPSGWIWSALNYICTHSALLKQKQQKKKPKKVHKYIYSQLLGFNETPKEYFVAFHNLSLPIDDPFKLGSCDSCHTHILLTWLLSLSPIFFHFPTSPVLLWYETHDKYKMFTRL